MKVSPNPFSPKPGLLRNEGQIGYLTLKAKLNMEHLVTNLHNVCL